MPFALAIIGIVLVVAGARGTGNIKALGNLLTSEFTGANNFLVWIFAIALVGVVGYIPGLEKLSRAFLILLGIVILLATKGGFLSQIQSAFANAGSGSTTVGQAVGNAVNGTAAGLTGTAAGLTGTPLTSNPAPTAPSTSTVQ